MRFVPFFGLAALLLINSNSFASGTITVTNDWAYGSVRIAAPDTGQPLYDWSDTQEGEAVMGLSLYESGLMPDVDPYWEEPYNGTAIASIGPGLLWDIGLAYPPMFGILLVADDGGCCHAQGTMETIWCFSVGDTPVSFIAKGFADGMGPSLNFILSDITDQQLVQELNASTPGGYNATGTLLPFHDYLLYFQGQAPSYDGALQFAFGVDDATVIFSPDRTHLPLPEPSSAICFVVAALLNAFNRRRR